jgi:DNA-binding NarL/FixJ family response regulator
MRWPDRAGRLDTVTLVCLLVDDNHHFLAAARDLLEREGLVVAGTATDIAGAVGRAAALAPDVALVDINLGGESGFALAARLAPTPVIMISTHAGDDYQDLIEDSPAIGFLAKTALSAAAVRDLLASARL